MIYSGLLATQALAHVGSGVVTFEQFTEYTRLFLNIEIIAQALRKFDLLPSAGEE
jgi:hypothetical protein